MISVKQLTALLNKTKMNGRPQPQQRKPKSKKKKQQTRKPGMSKPALLPADGSIRIKRKELMRGVTTSINKGDYADMYPQATVLPFLHTLANSYSEIKWHKLVFHWTPSVGTTIDGMVYAGFSFGVKGAEFTKEKICTYQPNFMTPVWKPASLVVPSARLMTRLTYTLDAKTENDVGPGCFCWFVETETAKKAYGNFWCEYDVTLIGPTS